MKLLIYLHKNKIKLKDMAITVGCSTPYFSHIVNHRKIPSIKMATKIEEATGGEVKADDLIKEIYKDKKLEVRASKKKAKAEDLKTLEPHAES